MPVDLIQKRKHAKQVLARLDVDETLAGIQERKARHHRLIALGAKVENHAIAGWDEATIEGALDEQDVAAKDPKVLARWRRAGEEKLARASDIRSVSITFTGPVLAETIAALKDKKFRLNRLRGEWEGRCDLVTAGKLAEPNGRVQILGQPAVSQEAELAAE